MYELTGGAFRRLGEIVKQDQYGGDLRKFGALDGTSLSRSERELVDLELVVERGPRLQATEAGRELLELLEDDDDE